MRNDLSEFIPWILAIFFVLFLIACCSWLYRCIQKCDDQCPGILPARSPYNPNSPMTPFQSVRNTRNCEGTRRLTCRRATNDSSEPSGSCISSSSVVHYHGQKAPPYVSFADRPPPPTYEEACSSGTAASTDNPEQSVARIDTSTTNETENPATLTVSASDAVQIESNAAQESIPNSIHSDGHNDTVDAVNESVAIDSPQDEPLINADDDDDDLHDVVIETSTSDPPPPAGEETVARESCNVYL